MVRSSPAGRTGDAVAGTSNIPRGDGYELDGGYVRAGALYFDDEELEPSLGLVYGGAVGPGRLLVGLNLQGRHNPKRKSSLRYGDSPENNADYAVDDFDNREDQRSEEHTSELQSLMRNSYAVFCLKKKKENT